MSAFQQFKDAVHLPARLGAELPYVRLIVTNEEQDAGVDGDVEFQVDSRGAETVSVTIIAWSLDARGQVIREQAERFVFGLPEGDMQLPEDVDVASAMAALLVSVSGMRPVPEAADPT